MSSTLLRRADIVVERLRHDAAGTLCAQGETASCSRSRPDTAG
ncbi:hypothetical protein [Microbacterium hydrocarbonoxydans]|nr:hypothetical protein [Microbacterium hydrocarbonoxydans]